MISSADPELQRLRSALAGLREASVSASVQHLARTARPDDSTGAEDITRRSYKCRSDLSHGRRSDTDLSALYAEALPLVVDMIRISRPRRNDEDHVGGEAEGVHDGPGVGPT